MKKILKFGLGIIAGATVAHVAYHGYKTMEEEVIHELTDRARQHFSTRKIDAFWIFEEPTTGALFEGGLDRKRQSSFSRLVGAEIVILLSQKCQKLK